MRRWLLTGAVLAAACTGAPPPAVGAAERERPRAQTWYVSASAPTAGTGTRRRPLDSLAAAERRSRPGDTIVVLPSGDHVPPLDGGIALKPRQRLVGAPSGPTAAARIANLSPERHHGDAVVLSDGVTVRDLVITGAHRGGIYGEDVSGVRISGNDVTGHNESCTEGFHIPPFEVPTTIPGVGIPISEGLKNGWAGIMVDADGGEGRVRITDNHVHDAGCGDGIDIRLGGTANYRALVAGNVVERLKQGAEHESVLAIGLQTRDHAQLAARLDRNVQIDLGDPAEPNVLVLGADTEGIFVNPAGPSQLDVTVSRNTYVNRRGLGGFSANGLEFVAMGDGPRASVHVVDSRFTGTPGDVIEQLALGTNATLEMSLERVVASRSVGTGNTVVIPGNNGDCLLAGSGGAGNMLRLTVRDSELTGCANNGLTAGSNVVMGEGPAAGIHVDVADSRITGNRGGNLVVGNYAGLRELTVKVERTNLSGSRGQGSGRANVTVQELGTTERAVIDLGGGPLGSGGGNCLRGGALAADVIGHDVFARFNWWGGESGPGPGRTIAAEGALIADPALNRGAPSCHSSSAITSR